MNFLSLSPDDFTRILTDTGLVLFGLDADGNIVEWTEAANGLLGFTASQVEGQGYEALVPEQEIGEFRKMVDKVRRGRRVKPFRSVMRTAGGDEIHVRVANTPIVAGENNKVSAVLVLLQNLTDAVLAERSLNDSVAQIRAIFQTVPDAIVIIDDSGIIESMNPAAETMFAYRAHEVIGRPVSVFIPEQYDELIGESLATALDESVGAILGTTVEAVAKRRNGAVFPVELAVAEVEAEGRRSFAGVVRDISERKEAEETMRQLNASLEKEVEERTRINQDLLRAMQELKDTQEQLVQSEKLASLGGMVAGVAHEINTPLGVGITAASILKTHADRFVNHVEAGTADEKVYKSFASVAQESIKMLESNLARAADLVKSFKQIAVDQSSSQRRTFNIHELVHEILTSLQPKLRKYSHKVEVECPEGLSVYGHPGLISQVLTNFIMNSLLHAYDEGEAGTLRIQISVNGNRLHLVYSDDGKGMSEADRKKVFEPFFTTRRGTGGTGLGMHIVYNLVKSEEGGQISVHSAPGEGVRFELDLPVGEEPAVPMESVKN